MSRTLNTTVRVWFGATIVTVIVAACGPSSAPAADVPAAKAPVAAVAVTEAATIDEAPATEAPATEAPATEAAPGVQPTANPAAEAAPAGAGSADAAPVSASENRTFAIDPAQSEASYFVEEEFLGQTVNFVNAVGRTNSIEGSIDMAVGDSSVTIGANEFTVDLRTLTSDQRRRDNAIRDRWLQSNRYPLAVFRATEVTALPADAALGAPVAFELTGDITIREITQPLTWNVTATLDGNTLSGTAQSFLLMRDFGFEPPDIAGMLRVTDGVTVTVNFVANSAS